MTIYSGTVNHIRNKTIDAAPSPLFGLNLVLAILALAVLSVYIFLSNFLVSQKYALGIHRQSFSQMSAGLPSEASAENTTYDIKDLLLFAQMSGLVEAREISAILEEGGVALSGTAIISPGR